MPVQACQPETTLRDYVAGYLPDEDSALVSRHLEECENCGSVVSRLETSGDSLVRHLRLAPTDNASERRTAGEDWEACLSRLKQLPSQLAPSDVESQPPPQMVHHYRLLEVLGRGGMGVVYRSWHPQLHRDVAVKLLATTRAADAQAVVRFQREMRAAGNLDHPAIVRALDAGESDGTNYLVMEHVDGIDLSKVVRRCGPLSLADACQVAVDAAEALQYAHERGVVHRDVKPSNIMLASSGQVKLLDFGLAALQSMEAAGGDGASSSGRLLGSLDYLAPEQASGSGPVGPAADIYSLGATLFKLLTTQPPHGSDDQPLLRRLQTISEQPCPRVDALRHDLPAEFADVLAKMLATDPSTRFQDAAEVARHLRPFAADSKLQTLAVEAASHSQVRGAAEPPDGLPAESRKASPKWWTIIATCLLGTLIGIASVVIWLNTGEGKLEIISEVDDVTLKLEGNNANRPLEVSHGATEVSVRAGKYQIDIAEAADRVVVEPSEIRVWRGQQLTVRILKHPAAAEPASANAAGTVKSQQPIGNVVAPAPNSPQQQEQRWMRELAQKREQLTQRLSETGRAGLSSTELRRLQRELDLVSELLEQDSTEPTYQGRSFNQWIRILRRETDLETLAAAIQATLQLGLIHRPSDTLDALVATAERLDGDFEHAENAFLRLAQPAPPNLQRGPGPRSSMRSIEEVDPWREAMLALSEGISRLPAHLRDTVIERLNQSVGGRKLLLTVVHKKLTDAADMDGWLQQLPVQAAHADPHVRGTARYLQIYHDFATDQDIHDALADQDLLVAKAALEAICDTKSITHPEQTGQTLGRLLHDANTGIGSPYSTNRLFQQLLTKPDEFSSYEANATLARTAREIVSRWSQRTGAERRQLPAAMLCGWIAAAGAVDPQTAETAAELLRQSIQQQLEIRKSYVPTRRDDQLNPETGLFGHVLALAQIDGWLPDSLVNAKIDQQSPLGKQLHEWMASDPGYNEYPPMPVLNWFPVECMQFALQKHSDQLNTIVSSRGFLAGNELSSNRGLLAHSELALSLAVRIKDEKMHATLAMLLKTAGSKWVPRQQMLAELLAIAKSTQSDVLRREAMTRIKRSSQGQEETLAFAREYLQKLESPHLADDWVIAVFLDHEDWTATDREVALMMLIAKKWSDSLQLFSQRRSSGYSVEVQVERTQRILQLIQRLEKAGELADEILRRLLQGQGPQPSRSYPHNSKEAVLFNLLRIHPKLFADLMLALQSMRGQLSDQTTKSLRMIESRPSQLSGSWAQNPAAIDALRLLNETIEAVAAPSQEDGSEGEDEVEERQ